MLNYCRRVRRGILATALLLAAPSLLFAWGNWGHQRINRAAVLALPAAMRTFFYNHVDFMVTEAVIPDSRKYVINDKAEFPRHFIDLEDYGTGPISELPKGSTEAYAKYDAAFLDKSGRLPWYVQDLLVKLTTAMKNQRKDEILFVAADLGHYLGDAHQPLHTSSNHDGQLTGQKGVHSFYESQLPELFGKNYNFKLAEPKLIADPAAEIWRIVAQSHAAADTLLAIEKKLAGETPAGQLYEMAGEKPRKNVFNSSYHTQAYSSAYHKALNNMIERQIRGAAQDAANFWYTAWVNAGKPDLTKLDTEYTTKSNEKNLKEELKLLEKGKLVDFSSFPEFPQAQ
ncbi:S1/P1 Nuclease [Hymenobacter busanensis]|uniref:S1/P1 Nuclease n=1 Tax=Hymenobacter busanensis TaxID=2607656 RepID=A0A7L4ZSV3_9BACT|nr:zinc dependent phospholipase C family protein [Hymenobacter busanensis]KAA9327667.1 S1/P1 Nuclease [Hymenobacter busanensis]QHJ05993.1 S1/P1 Nuclease [Hymenobacter busanensis]